jgi:hypothetical protein
MARGTKTTATVVADICLYGTSRTGAGFLGCVMPHGQTFGTGDPVAGRTFTEAIWLAQDAIRALGVRAGKVRVFHPGGEFMSVIDLNTITTYGSLASVPAPQFTISADALIAAAERGRE